jgi:hypothetical protein
MEEGSSDGLNEALFRDVNERIGDISADWEGAGGETFFVCECSHRDCTESIPVSQEVYERVREDGRRFIVFPGHEDASVESVVARFDAFVVVEKTGPAGHQADVTDPRTAEQGS